MNNCKVSTRLLSKDQPISSNDIGFQLNFSALLLGSPGETVLNLDSANKKSNSTNNSRFGLSGVLRDLMLARAFLSQNGYGIYECMHGIRLFKTEIMGALAMFFSQEHVPQHFAIYFSGQGRKGTGNWIFTDGELSLREVHDIFDKNAPSESNLSIIADCSHSGAWVEQLLSNPENYHSRIAIQAACLKEEICIDTEVGGLFTKSWVSGNYYKLAKNQLSQFLGQRWMDEVEIASKPGFYSYVPVTQTQTFRGLYTFLISTFYTCSNECTNIVSDLDPNLQHLQHPIATHPYAFNLIFHDNRFAEIEPSQRFPEKDVPRHFIDLQKFWLGSE